VNKISTEKLFKIAYSYLQNKNYIKSIELFKKIQVNYPNNLSVLRNLSHAYAFSGDFINAENTIKNIIKLNENEPYIFQFLASILRNQDKIEEMISLIDKGLKKNLMNPKWKYQKDLLFPIIMKDNKEIHKYREKVSNCYDQILKSNEELNYDNDQIIQTPHYEMSYNQHDNLELNIKSVKALRKIYKELNETSVEDKNKNEKIKIGFISEFFTNHTIGRLFKNIIFSLDQSKFNIFVFHSNKTKKNEIFNEFVEKEKKGYLKNITLPKKLNEKIKIFKKEKFHILFYPDIGMSVEMYYLSLIRLAKYQIMSWGHPETTGSESIDYFLCSKTLITYETAKSYSEKLLLMDQLPMIYEIPNVENKLNDKSLSKNNIYSCPQTMFKFHPDFDHILSEILKKDKKGILYLIKDTNKVYYHKLIERFKKIKDFDLDRVIFIDQLNRDGYINHLGSSSVLLDPLYFGAGNSFHESMVYGTPTVTMPTKFIKSRIVTAAYIQMEVDNPPIVKNEKEYIEMAVDFANAKDLSNIKKYYREKAKQKLFNTKNVGREFNQILLNLHY
tara:strand:- start:2261 stop:3934 length:1674 start_codon:yes stop_codon:yes gene_type:complete